MLYAYYLIYNHYPRMRKLQLKKIKQLARSLSQQQNKNLNQSLTQKPIWSSCYTPYPACLTSRLYNICITSSSSLPSRYKSGGQGSCLPPSSVFAQSVCRSSLYSLLPDLIINTVLVRIRFHSMGLKIQTKNGSVNTDVYFFLM